MNLSYTEEMTLIWLNACIHDPKLVYDFESRIQSGQISVETIQILAGLGLLTYSVVNTERFLSITPFGLVILEEIESLYIVESVMGR